MEYQLELLALIYQKNLEIPHHVISSNHQSTLVGNNMWCVPASANKVLIN